MSVPSTLMSLRCFYLHCGVNHEGGWWCWCPVASLSYTSSMHKQILVEIKIKSRRKMYLKEEKNIGPWAMGGCCQLLWRWRLRQRWGWKDREKNTSTKSHVVGLCRTSNGLKQRKGYSTTTDYLQVRRIRQQQRRHYHHPLPSPPPPFYRCHHQRPMKKACDDKDGPKWRQMRRFGP